MTIEGRDDGAAGGRIRLGMVGGGQGAFIGGVHRMAARLDDHFVLLAGALSGDPARARASAADLGLPAERSYDDFRAMAAAEAVRPDGVEAVAVVTPNHLHCTIARSFIEAGIAVICDKPLAADLQDALDLADVVERAGLPFFVTYNYSGYPLVRQAREMVAAGELGEIRVVQVEYPQDWLTEPLEESGQKQAGWRTDPARAGAGGCLGDIGTHAFHLAGFVSGLQPDGLCADLATFVPGRRLDDNVHVLLRYPNGARGMLWSSQVAPGNENGLRLRLYGSRGGLEWAQEEPNRLWFTPFGEPKRLITRAGAGAGPAAARVTRIPAGHPEGYIEGFATLYTEAARILRARRAGEPPAPEVLCPGIADGVRGVAFVDAAVRSSRAGSAWIAL